MLTQEYMGNCFLYDTNMFVQQGIDQDTITLILRACQRRMYRESQLDEHSLSSSLRTERESRQETERKRERETQREYEKRETHERRARRMRSERERDRQRDSLSRGAPVCTFKTRPYMSSKRFAQRCLTAQHDTFTMTSTTQRQNTTHRSSTTHNTQTHYIHITHDHDIEKRKMRDRHLRAERDKRDTRLRGRGETDIWEQRERRDRHLRAEGEERQTSESRESGDRHLKAEREERETSEMRGGKARDIWDETDEQRKK